MLYFRFAKKSKHLFLKTDGAGNLSFDSLSFSTPLAVIGNATAGSEIRLPEDTDNGSNYVAIKAPNTIASNLTLTLPSADGSSGQVLQTNGSGVLSFAGVSAGFTLGTAVATTSGTAFDFTGIPDTAKLIIINFSLVSVSGNDGFLIQIGDSGGFETTGYESGSVYLKNAVSVNMVTSTSGFIINIFDTGFFARGQMILSLVDSSTYTWSSQHTLGGHDAIFTGGGNKSLSDVLTQVRITRTGTNTFDNGKLNIMYI